MGCFILKKGTVVISTVQMSKLRLRRQQVTLQNYVAWKGEDLGCKS